LPERVLVESVREKVFEGIERTQHLISLVPADRLAWHPELRAPELPTPEWTEASPAVSPAQSPTAAKPPMDLGHILGHLLDCLAGFCAVFYAAFPQELADFAKLRDYKGNRACSLEAEKGSTTFSPETTSESIDFLAAAIHRGFQRCIDADLSRRIPTVFVPEGETLLTLLLGNFEHLTNHKYQLFLHLKLAGVPVTSRDLYQFRDAKASAAKVTSGSEPL
jgi:hypothetical protein